MVVCNFFMNGHCRFGSKCMNDHIDFKALLKSEVEAAINGKQWLLSCFGPFKESVSIPNLIDRSFEEVRLDFLEANKNGTVQQHVNELISQYTAASQQLNHIKLGSPETIQLVAGIYNQSVSQDTKKPAGTTNVFSLSNASTAQPQQQQNPFQMGSVFGGFQLQQTTSMNAGSIFGGSATSNPFQSSSQSSIFGAPKEQPTSAANFSFSLGQQAAPQSSIFGSSQQQTAPQNSIFGGSQAAPAMQQSSITSSVFGGSQPATQQSSIFSGSQPTSSVFGGPPSFGNSSSIFASAAPQQQSNSIFGSSMFGQPQQAQGGNIFASAQPTPQPASTFAQPSANIFGGFQSQPEIQQQPSNIFAPTEVQQQPQSNIFAQPSQTPQNVFSMTSQTTPAAPPGSIFQIQQPTAVSQQQNYAGNPFASQPAPIDESVYSKPESLTPEEVQAFQAERFQLGGIPVKPPPKQLCF